MSETRVPIRFDAAYSWLSRALLISPDDSYVRITGSDVEVRMAWAFRARFRRSAVVAVAPWNHRTLSLGVHGFAGRWLVNGSTRGIVSIELGPGERGFVMGFPVRLHELLVSVDDPTAFIAALGG